MSRLLTCPKGHCWEVSQGASAAMSGSLVCPVCGAAARPPESLEQTLAAEAQESRTLEQTLPTPLPAPRRSAGEATAAPMAVSTSGRERSLSVGQVASQHSLGGRGSPATGTTGAGSLPAAAASSYTLIRLHASGGLGCVSVARDEAIQREVALKQIQPHLADNPSSRARFVYEAKITGRLEHPGIVPVYTMGSDTAGHPYYVMRFLRGRTLDDHINDYMASPNPVVFRALLRHFIAVCHAIAYAHSRGIIHRDIKPANIMIGDYGETYVLDWGLAKDLKDRGSRALDTAASVSGVTAAPGRGASSLTQDGQIIGTPAYMAPEQASGQTDLHGPATDIFSLGAVLYKLLTGKAPNVGKSSTSLALPNYKAPPKPSELSKDVPLALERICLKAMAPRAEERYQSAMEFRQELERWLDDTPLQGPRQSLRQRFLGWVRANLLMVLVWSAVGLAAILLGLAWILSHY